jgi:hypothetical protein
MSQAKREFSTFRSVLPLWDYSEVQPIYVDGLAHIEQFGAVVHLTFTVQHRSGGQLGRNIRCRLIVPVTHLETLGRQLLNPRVCAPVDNECEGSEEGVSIR